ncbi:MAG: ATP-dependent DNA helicase RecG [Lachnospiraceae bacterium]|nr:ATP-dependent DNA helicase RecG [Lachnospiraceae bacterium]
MRRSIRELKGIGEKTERLFNRLGVYSLDDLTAYYPRTYDIYREPQDMDTWREKEQQAIRARIDMPVSVKSARPSSVTTTSVRCGDQKITIIWFQQPFLRSTLKRGCWYVFRGRVVRRGSTWEMEQPKIYDPDDYEKLLHTMQPVYGLTKGLTNQAVVKAIRQAFEMQPAAGDCLPGDIRERYQLMDADRALSAIHFPRDQREYMQARRRLVFDGFLLFILGIRQLRERTETAENRYLMKPVWDTEQIIEALPYTLTDAQQRVWEEIETDLQKGTLMSRLIQGDVGSGKTILAYLAMVMAAKNGYQAALMVPTEVLAVQHYEGLLKLFKEQGICDMQVTLLTGSNTQKEKREICAQIQSGEADLIIGTHALIQEGVRYHSLGLVVTDEQHRFGVKQRETLSLRGGDPHVLVMSATPIPRTLAMILYGDLDISVIDELPAKRLPIKNCVVGIQYRPTAYRFIEKQIAQGRQAYVICPMVEESEGLEGENVLDYAKRLQEALPREIRISPLHGKMKPKEKTGIMERFARHELDVLVSTTVIEVGVDVPNATVMMVENAERFGLAQLHQLRGRVGRGEHQSYCIFVQGGPDEEIKKRLEILNHSNDGFHIAAEDLKLRGPGDLFGIRQSGMMDLRIGDIYKDSDVLRQASQAAQEMLGADPYLERPEYKGIREKVEAAFKEGSFHATL